MPSVPPLFPLSTPPVAPLPSLPLDPALPPIFTSGSDTPHASRNVKGAMKMASR
jgi:hypothetical protein